MPPSSSNHAYDHHTPESLGVLLVNLGTPSAPTTAAVRRYLKQFLSDPRVIDYPRWLWWPILHGIILRIRPRKSAHAYQQIWTDKGSPLLMHTNALAGALHEQLKSAVHTDVQLAVGMTYGEPSIAHALVQLQQANVRKLIVLPLYPQYSVSTTASVFDAVSKALKKTFWLPELRFINNYHDDEQYIAALAQSVVTHWQKNERNHLLLSFHGLPQRYLYQGDPYHCHCLKTARLVAEKLHLKENEWTVSFQSRVGREQWLQPYTDQTLLRFAREGIKRVTVMCPGFAVDCLETLEEIAIRNKEDFLAAGGESFAYIPALNDDASHVQVLSGLIRRHVQGWLPLSKPDVTIANKANELAASAMKSS
ncbi:MAG TPA: ferrochelatase [Steroidobacteraceae bacterium]|nr:ferrochelatase [Steroidobacteraceae bacterium]